MLPGMIRADLPLAVSLPPLRIPAWALPDGPVEQDEDAAFFAGAALHSLDALVRSEPVWAGAWRQRLALKCAARSLRLLGRGEDEPELRDAWYLRAPGVDPGPAGAVLGVWKALASRHLAARATASEPLLDADDLASATEAFGLRHDAALVALLTEIDDRMHSPRSAPFLAADIAAHVIATRPDAGPLAWWLADLVLAKSLRWPRPVPLVITQIGSPGLRGRGTPSSQPGENGRAVCLALVRGAADALRLAGDIGRRAERLRAAAPKLRAKGAGEAIQRLLEDDAVPGTLTTKSLSRFGARRLFARLQAFDAVRELSGRSSFRLYGL
jgi:hypothetical protein